MPSLHGDHWIIGSLLYCGEVLAVDLSKKIAALRCHAEATAEAGRLQSWDHKIWVGACAVSQLAQWTCGCLLNDQVHVTNGKRIDCGSTTILVDASLCCDNRARLCYTPSLGGMDPGRSRKGAATRGLAWLFCLCRTDGSAQSCLLLQTCCRHSADYLDGPCEHGYGCSAHT